jgi:uncharacterized protein YllA (UPF0747 family)
MLLRALDRASAIAAALAERDSEIARAGFEPQVAAVSGLSLVFETTAGGKRRISLREARGAQRRSFALTANVLLRPVVERAIVPTVAYVAGPAELAYFAQVSAIATALSAPAPVAVPRWSGTVVEPHVARILDRFGLRVEDLRDPNPVIGRLARAALPEREARLLAELRHEVESAAAELAADGPGGLVPEAVVEGARRSIEHRIDRLERRLLAAVKRRERDMMRAIATARGSLFPLGKRQERALNLIPLLARYGPALLDAVRAAAGRHATALVFGADAPVGAGERAPA